MQEHTVTVMGVSRKMPEPFFVLATQNPVEQDGTFPSRGADGPLYVQARSSNPSLEELIAIVDMTQKTMAEVAAPACNGDELLAMRRTANQIPVAEDVMKYAMTLCSAPIPTANAPARRQEVCPPRRQPPRGSGTISAAKVKALMKGRFNVAFSDLNELAYPVLRHRMKMNFEAIAERVSPDDVITMIVAEVSKKFGINGKKPAEGKKAEIRPAKEETADKATEEAAATEEQPAQAEAKASPQKRKRGACSVKNNECFYLNDDFFSRLETCALNLRRDLAAFSAASIL